MDDRLQEAVIANFGENRGTPIAKRYLRAFPRSYKEAMLPGSAVADIERLEGSVMTINSICCSTGRKKLAINLMPLA